MSLWGYGLRRVKMAKTWLKKVEKMRKYDLYWKGKPEWWTLKNHVPVVRKDAPTEAQESYQRYLQQISSRVMLDTKRRG